MKKIIAGSLLTLAMATAGGDIAPVEPVVVEEESTIKQSFSLYGMAPSLDGSYIVNIPDGGTSDDTDFIDKLDMAFFAAYEIRDEKWLFYTDFLYVDMSDDHNIYLPGKDITLRTENELEVWMLSAYAGYNMIDNADGTLDLIAGLRWLSVNDDLALRTAPFEGIGISPSWDMYDAVIGIKGHRNINENWFVPYMADIGTGDTKLTYQAMAGIGYRYGWGDVLLSYRYISYDHDDNGIEAVKDLELYGPQIGVIWRF